MTRTVEGIEIIALLMIFLVGWMLVIYDKIKRVTDVLIAAEQRALRREEEQTIRVDAGSSGIPSAPAFLQRATAPEEILGPIARDDALAGRYSGR